MNLIKKTLNFNDGIFFVSNLNDNAKNLIVHSYSRNLKTKSKMFDPTLKYRKIRAFVTVGIFLRIYKK